MRSVAKSLQRTPAPVAPVHRVPEPVAAAFSPLRRLQRCAGNQAAERLLASEGDGRMHRCGPIPCNCSPEERAAKEGLPRFPYDGLSVSDPAEPAEREADAVADRVMRMIDVGAIGSEPVDVLHRHGSGEPGGGGHSSGLAAGIAQQISAGGQGLGGAEREFMEARFGRELGRVRIHADATAGRLARQADAHAFTVGRHIFFGAGQWRPGEPGGRRLLAHELTHVVQQAGPGRIQRQAAPTAAEKTSGTLAAAYERLGDYRRAAAIRSCQQRGGPACKVVLTQAEVRRLYELAQSSGGDEKKMRAGVPLAASGALAGMVVTTGLPPVGPVPPPIGAIPPVGPVTPPPTGFPTWGPPPPVAGAPVAEGGLVEGGLVEGGVATGGEAAGGVAAAGTTATVAVAAAVTLIVVAGVAAVVEAWQYSKFSHELEAQGFVVLDDALAICIQGCHTPNAPIRTMRDFPDFDSPRFKPFFDLPPRPLTPFPPFPGRPAPMIPVDTTRKRPHDEHDEPDKPRERKKNPRRDPQPQPHTDHHPDEDDRRDPCDTGELVALHPCTNPKSFDEAMRELGKPADARSTGREAANGDCFTDGKKRGLNDPLGRFTHHETWYDSKNNRVGTIKCCPCCTRGAERFDPVGQNCSVVF